jgi:hypothetical protein
MPRLNGDQFRNFKEGDVVYKGLHLRMTRQNNYGKADQYEVEVRRITAGGKKHYAHETGSLPDVKKNVRNMMQHGYTPHEEGHLELRED